MLREALTLDRLHAMEPDDAAAYFVTWGAEGLTASEQSLMEGWLVEGAENAGALARANRAWNTFGDAEGDEIMSALREHALAAVPRRRPAWLGAMVAVAAALLLVIGGVLGSSIFRGTITPQGQGSAIEYASLPGQVREVTLADGTHMTLDADSLVRARFGPAARSLQLVRGRAFFDVKHDALRPFAVGAATRRIVDVGTRFDVSIRDGALHVTLEEGRLSVESLAPGAAAIPLHAGQEFVETTAGATVRTIGADDTAVTGWRRGLISFEDTPLSAAIVEVNRYSRQQIVIRDPQVGRMMVSGQFRAGDADRFASTIAEIRSVHLVRQGDRIEIAPAR
jgi:transmembrane sensor